MLCERNGMERMESVEGKGWEDKRELMEIGKGK